jgi:hypothetical protein
MSEGMVKQLWVEDDEQEWGEVATITLLPRGALAELGRAVAELHYVFDWQAIMEPE